MQCYFIMNYSLSELPNSGKNPVVYIDIELKSETLGRIFIQLFRDAFPAGVENFIKIIEGKTYNVKECGYGKCKYQKQIKRSYEGCKFFNFLHGNYIVTGDIYNNNGTNAGTIFKDEPIPFEGDFFYPHEKKGLVSLIPFKDEATGKIFYDSTFMITLDDIKPNNILGELDIDHVVIGNIYNGLDVLEKMNSLIKPFARKRYPQFTIKKCDVYKNNVHNRHPFKSICLNNKGC